MSVKYSLVDIDGNAFSVMAKVLAAMKKEDNTMEEQDKYKAAAMSGDYDNLLQVSICMIDKINKEGR